MFIFIYIYIYIYIYIKWFISEPEKSRDPRHANNVRIVRRLIVNLIKKLTHDLVLNNHKTSYATHRNNKLRRSTSIWHSKTI